MKYFDLNKEEEKILADLETGKFKSVPNLPSEIKRFKKIASTTLAKRKNINLRLSQKTLIKIRAKAAALGIPYQTLASSVLHRYAVSNNSLLP